MKIKINATDPIYGAQLGMVNLIVHDEGRCAGQNCSIHNPSQHPLDSAPLNWRSDTQVMERLCEHGIGHPDPDHIAFVAMRDPYEAEAQTIHGCDGCCVKIEGATSGL